MELGKQFLIKLKTLSNYKKITFLILVIATFLSILRLLVPRTSNLKEEDTTFYGYIEKYSKTDQYTTFEIRLKNGKGELLQGIIYKNIDLEYHDYIKVEGTKEKINDYCNFSCFSYSQWANRKNMYYNIEAQNIEIVKKNQNIFYLIKNKIVEIINKNPSSSYLFALILGDDSKIDDNVQKSYQENGISHLFAISGMHLSFLVTFFTYLFKKFHFNEKTSYFILFSTLVFYLFLVSFSVSVLRAFFFLLFKKIKEKISCKEHNIFPLIQAFSLLILINPSYLFDISFCYSFTISFAIVIVRHKLKKITSPILSSLALSFLAFFISLPISIFYFHQVNVLGILYNLFFIPLVSIFLFPFSFVVFFLPFLSPIYEIFVFILENTSLFLSNITIGMFTMRHPSFLVLCLIIVIVLISLFLFMKKIKYSVIFILMFVFIYSNINFFLHENYFVMLDVGQGDSFLIYSENKSVLIDTGGNLYTDLSEKVIIPYLKSCGINKLDFLLLTHGDFDHMGEAVNLVNNFKIEKVIFNHDEYNDLELKLIEVLENKNISYYKNVKELNIKDHKLYFLNTELYDNENDNSNVIYAELNNYKFLFMGDAGVEVEEDLLEKYNLKNIDVLKVGHHGSKTSSSQEFIDSINPTYSIISVGKNNRYGHPNDIVLDNLKNSKIYRTDQDGSVMFKIKNDKLKIETCLP